MVEIQKYKQQEGDSNGMANWNPLFPTQIENQFFTPI